jgi:UDP-glucose 4-epimerase
MRIVVTGASGRVGRAIVVRLSRAHDVTGIDRAPSSTADHVGDFLDPALLDRAFAGADAVVHAAALHAPHVGVLPDAEFERINVDGTRAVVEAMVRHEVPRLVFTSTTALYGAAAERRGHAVWVDESTVPAPRTIYHRTKLAAESYLREAAQRHGIAVRVLRMSRCFPEAAPVMAVYRLHRGIDARDVAAAHEAAIAHDGPLYAVHVVSGATPFHPEDAEALAVAAPAVVERRCPALADAFTRRGWTLPASIDRVYDASLASAELGWRARHGWDEVLAMYDRESSEVLPPGRATRSPE